MVKRVLSIEIGLQKTRICEVDYGKKVPRVYNCVEFDTPDNTIEDGYIRDKETFAVAMKEKLAAAKMKITEVIFTIASTKIANREVTIPLVKKNRIQEVVDAGAQDYFPVDISEYVVAYSILKTINTTEEKSYNLLLLAAPSNLIRNYYNFAELMGFHIVAIDYIGNSGFQSIKKQVGKEVSLSIQMNEQTTLINVIDNEVLTLQRTLPYGIMSVVDSVLDNKIFEKSTSKEAIEFLCKEQLIHARSHYENDEAAAALAEQESEDNNLAGMEAKAKNEVTESLNYLVSNIIRVLDYYNSKNPEKRIEKIFITGQGAEFLGIEELFASETGLEVSKIDQLTSAYFGNKSVKAGIDRTLYLSAIGAAIAPIGFIPKDMLVKEAKKTSISNMAFIVILSVFVSVVMIVISTVNLYTAKSDKKDLESQITALLSVENTYNQYDIATKQYQKVETINGLTNSPNEGLNDLLSELEAKLPSSMTIVSLSSNDTGISMNIKTDTKLSVAKMLIQLRQIETIKDPVVQSVAQQQEENGLTIVTFSVSCTYADADKTADSLASADTAGASGQ